MNLLTTIYNTLVFFIRTVFSAYLKDKYTNLGHKIIILLEYKTKMVLFGAIAMR